MKLLSLHIESFGALHDYTASFSDGLNVRLHPNGWGKSTLSVFLKAMLYGLPATTKRSLIENERKRYTPWQGGVYGGSLDLEVEGRLYRIERTFGTKEAEDTLQVLSMPTGDAADVDWKNAPGERLFGIDAAAYERSTYLSQRPADVFGDGSVSIQTKLNDLSDTADDLGNYDRAMELLERRRRVLHHLSGGGGAIAQDENRLSAVERELEGADIARRALEECSARMATAQANVKELNETIERLRSEEVRVNRARTARQISARRTQLQEQLTQGIAQREQLLTSVGGTVPTDQEVEALSSAVRAHREARLAPHGASLTEEEQAEMETLSRAFPRAEEIRQEAGALRAQSRELDRAAVLADASLSVKDADALLQELNKIDGELAAQTTQQNRLQPAESRTVKIIPIALGVLGAIAAIFGIVWLPALIIGGGLWLACALCALGLHTAKTRRAVEQMAQREELSRTIVALQGRRERLRVALALAEAQEKFRVAWVAVFAELPAPDAGDATAALERTLARCERLCELRARHERQAASQIAARAALDAAERQERELLSRYPDAPVEGERAIRWLDERRLALTALAENLAQWEKELATLPPVEEASPSDEPRSTSSPEALAQECARLEQQRELWSETLLQERGRKTHLEENAYDMDALESERDELNARIAAQTQSLNAIIHAQKYLKVAREALTERYLTTMQRSFGEYMSALTGGEAPSFTMSSNLHVKLRAAGIGRDADAFSVGVRDLIGFCERLALVDALFEGERPFLVLDDPFVNLDDTTTRRAGELLSQLAKKYQVLYLTCNESRVFESEMEKETNA